MSLSDKNQEKEIDGFTYVVTPLPFGVGRQALMRLIRVVSPVFSAALGGGKVEAAIFNALPLALSDDDVVYFAKVFGDASRYKDGEKLVPLVSQNQELHFAARYKAFLQWLIFCVEVNYKDFFVSSMSGSGVADFMATLTPSPST